MTITDPAVSPAADRLAAARLMLSSLGISVEDLTSTPTETKDVPTFDAYIPIVEAAVTPGTLRVYGSYWKRIKERWGERRLDEPTATEIAGLVELTKQNRVQRRNGRGGNCAGEHMVAAFRCLYKFAVIDEYITAASNPAAKVAKPRRLPSNRRGLPATQVDELVGVASSTGNDPALDALIVRFHLETAARRAAALKLRLRDIDEEQCLLLLQEKGGVFRWQPASPTLVAHLLDHAKRRGCLEPESRVLRNLNGKPITTRRYDGLWERCRKQIPWADRQQVATHWLRYTTLTFVERRFGLAVAQAYAGHETKNDAITTTTYVRAGINEVATALAALTGEPHPLAT